MSGTVPHHRTIIAFCVAAIIGYSVFSLWAVFDSEDAALRGDVIGTWKSFAVAAFAFWLGSSSGGKAAAGGDTPGPTPVIVDQPPAKREIPEPAFALFDGDTAEPKPTAQPNS